MQQTTDTVRIYLNKSYQGIVTCIHCGVQRTINMVKYPEYHCGAKALKVRCNVCQKTFHVRFDLRRYHRISTNFAGTLVAPQTGRTLSPVTIISLSVGGVGLQLSAPVDMRVGEVYELTFCLDDEDSSTICETITVQRVQGDCVGAEFSPHEKYHYELDFYIRSHMRCADF